MMKDNFSSVSSKYAQFRPVYPAEVFQYLYTLTDQKDVAWDCGTGNGQVAYDLAKTFRYVCATDISRSQIDHAIAATNIFYSVQPAEKTDFEDKKFNLITVAQAIHWFDFDRFYAEVNRTAKEGGLLCVLGYGRIQISTIIDNIINDFYTRSLGKYWDKERKYIDENYETIPFPFEEIKTPKFQIDLEWTLEHLLGYLDTWSAVTHFKKMNGTNPLEVLKTELEKHWQDGVVMPVSFPMLLRVGKIL